MCKAPEIPVLPEEKPPDLNEQEHDYRGYLGAKSGIQLCMPLIARRLCLFIVCMAKGHCTLILRHPLAQFSSPAYQEWQQMKLHRLNAKKRRTELLSARPTFNLKLEVSATAGQHPPQR